MIFDLWQRHTDYLGLVVPCASGVHWSTQTGGTYCARPKVEGIYLPLPLSVLPDRFGYFDGVRDPLRDFWVHGGDPTEHLSLAKRCLSEFLVKAELSAYFEPWDYPLYWGEAWVPVTVRQDQPQYGSELPFIDQIKGRNAFLTYPNSD
jgi:hypothetical protein